MSLVSHGVHSNQKVSVPDQLKYLLPQNSVPSRREVRSIRPASGSTFSDTGTSSILIHIPPVAYLDTKETFLQFKISATGTNVEYSGNGHCFIRRLQIRSGAGDVIEDINNYNVLQRMLSDFTVSQQLRDNAMSTLEGYGTQAVRRLWSAAGKTVSIQLLAGLFKSQKFLPMKYLKGGMYLEITLDSSVNCMMTSTGASTYALSEVQLTTSYVSFSQDIDQAVSSAIKTKGLQIHFASFASSVMTSTNSNETIIIPSRYKSLKTVFVVPRLNSVLNVDSSDSLGTRTFNTLTELTLRVDDYLQIPCSATSSAAQVFQELAKALNFNINGIITPALYSTFNSGSGVSFAFGFDLESVDSHVSGMSEGQLEINVVNASAPSATRYDVFLHYDSVLDIVENGVIVFK